MDLFRTDSLGVGQSTIQRDLETLPDIGNVKRQGKEALGAEEPLEGRRAAGENSSTSMSKRYKKKRYKKQRYKNSVDGHGLSLLEETSWLSPKTRSVLIALIAQPPDLLSGRTPALRPNLKKTATRKTIPSPSPLAIAVCWWRASVVALIFVSVAGSQRWRSDRCAG